MFTLKILEYLLFIKPKFTIKNVSFTLKILEYLFLIKPKFKIKNVSTVSIYLIFKLFMKKNNVLMLYA